MNANVCSPAPTDQSMVDDLIESHRAMARQTCRFLIQLREFDLHRAYKHGTRHLGHVEGGGDAGASAETDSASQVWGAASCTEWLAKACGMDEEVAREKLTVAYSLANLPRIEEAFEAGSLSYAKVRALVRVATTENEGSMLDFARVMTDAQVATYCERLAARKRRRSSE